MISAEEYSKAMSYVDGFEDLVPMQVLAYESYGKRLLLGNSWHGVIDLKNAKQMKYLHDYLGMS